MIPTVTIEHLRQANALLERRAAEIARATPLGSDRFQAAIEDFVGVEPLEDWARSEAKGYGDPALMQPFVAKGIDQGVMTGIVAAKIAAGEVTP